MYQSAVEELPGAAWPDQSKSANMEKKRSSGLLLLDMSAAFNLILKEVLIPKLIQLGLLEEAARLIESYMTGRINACKSGQELEKAVSWGRWSFWSAS